MPANILEIQFSKNESDAQISVFVNEPPPTKIKSVLDYDFKSSVLTRIDTSVAGQPEFTKTLSPALARDFVSVLVARFESFPESIKFSKSSRMYLWLKERQREQSRGPFDTLVSWLTAGSRFRSRSKSKSPSRSLSPGACRRGPTPVLIVLGMRVRVKEESFKRHTSPKKRTSPKRHKSTSPRRK